MNAAKAWYYGYLQRSVCLYTMQVRVAVWSASIRDGDAQGDVHANRRQQVHGTAARPAVRPRSHLPTADAESKRPTVAWRHRRRCLFRRRSHAGQPWSVDVRSAAEIPRFVYICDQVKSQAPGYYRPKVPVEFNSVNCTNVKHGNAKVFFQSCRRELSRLNW